MKHSKELYIYNLNCSTCKLSRSLLILTSTYYYVLLVATCSSDTLCISVKIQYKKIQTYIYVVILHSIISATPNHGIYSTIGRSVDQRIQFSRNCSNHTFHQFLVADLMIYFNFNTPMPILCIVAPIFKDKIQKKDKEVNKFDIIIIWLYTSYSPGYCFTVRYV